jgi:elongation factor G
MAEILSYQPELTSMTGGRGAFTMSLDHYEEAPSDIQAKIVETYQANRGEEEE